MVLSKKVILFLALILISTLTQTSLAQIPQTISYQGILTADNGEFMPDDTYYLKFRLYDTPTGGSELWSELHEAVPTENGVFNVILGSITPIDLPFDQQYYLAIQLDDEESPDRIQLTSVPYSFRASVADSVINGGGAFENVDNVVRNSGDDATDDFVFGSPTLNYDGDFAHAARFFLNKSKGAFRAGYDVSNLWDADSLGDKSIALGHNPIATGQYSTAIGDFSQARGPWSLALGSYAKALDDYSTAIGFNSNASGDFSTAIGSRTSAEALYQTSMGHNNTQVAGDPMYWVPTDRLFVIGNGSSYYQKSDALVMLKNGNTTLNGKLTLSDGSDSYTLPNTDGSANQTLQTDGEGNVSWQATSGGSGVFENASGVVRNTGNNETDDFVFGSPTLGYSGEESRLFFDKSKAAFRAGYDWNNYWHPDSLGQKSVALGANSIAAEEFSVAIGDHNQARGISSLALGAYSWAKYDYATAIGYHADAHGPKSMALGNHVTAESYKQITIGSYNEYIGGSIYGWYDNHPLFVIGNGYAADAKSNALVMLKNGDTTLKGKLTLSDGSNSYTLPNTDGGTGQVLKTNGSGYVYWSSDNGAFENASGVVRNSGNDTSDDFVFGSPTLAYDGNENHRYRFFFDKSKGAFRAGGDWANHWQPDSLGQNSVAIGGGNKARGSYSTAIGGYNSALADGSVAIGRSNQSSGERSVTLGGRLRAESFAQISIGYRNTEAQGNPNTSVSTDRLFVIGNGTDYYQSDALVMLKNGNTTLNGELTLSDGSDSYTLPNTDGYGGQVLKTNGSGDVYWGTDNTNSAGGEGVFENASGVVRNTGDDASDDFVFGSPTLAYDGNSNHKRRFFFDKSKGAFRAGSDWENKWDADSLGLGSIAMGGNVVATGTYAVALGSSNQSRGFGSTAIGGSNSSSQSYSTAIGYNNHASGQMSVALGGSNKAQSFGQISIGYHSTEVQGDPENWVSTDRLFVVGNGNNYGRSDALIMLKNGNTTLNGELTLSDGSDSYTLPNTDGSANQTLQTDGNGNVTWQTASGSGAFENASGVVRNSGHDETDNFVFGSPTLDYDGNSNHQSRFFFDKYRSAFRAGWAVENSWDADSLGAGSVALGNNPKATGYSAVALGHNSRARGSYSTAIGSNANATGSYSTAIGNVAYATGEHSTSIGLLTTAESQNQTTIGAFNTRVEGDPENWVDTDRLFVIGNGTSGYYFSDALVMLKNGNTTLNGELTLSDGSDSYTLPNTDGGNGQALITDGSGNVSWQTVSGGSTPSFSMPIVTVTDSYTITDADYTIICNTGDVDKTITLPETSSVDTGRIYNIRNIGLYDAIINASGNDMIISQFESSLSFNLMLGRGVTLQSDGNGNWILIGDLSSY